MNDEQSNQDVDAIKSRMEHGSRKVTQFQRTIPPEAALRSETIKQAIELSAAIETAGTYLAAFCAKVSAPVTIFVQDGTPRFTVQISIAPVVEANSDSLPLALVEIIRKLAKK